jgi:Cys-rich repeat protein|tara:strand:- start:3137 stop:5803 length:2667 start_codon:yes stop_codon:yes gene_type:complete
MSYINTSTEIKIYINSVDVTQYLIQGSISEDSAYSSNIITSRGQIVLGGTTDIFDFNRTKYPIGSSVDIWCVLDNGLITKHPKGRLYIMNSSTNIEDRTLSLEVGCSLAFISEREEQYRTKVQSLWGLLSSDDLRSFKVTETTLSNLSQYLECVGKVIFQDKYGYVQTVKAFGSNGIGAYAGTPKLVSFDTDTAVSVQSIADTSIETDVNSIKVEVSIDVPVLTRDDEEEDEADEADECSIDSDCPSGQICDNGVCADECTIDSDCPSGYVCEDGVCVPEEEDDPDEPTIPVPEPLISSVVSRTAKTPKPTGNLEFGQGPSSLTAQSNPKIATGENWDGTIGHNYQVTGQITVEDFPVAEKVTSGKYVEYKGPGNQVSFEQNWEHSSAATWANGAIRNTLTELTSEMNKVVEEINGLLQKANQAFDKRDEYNEGDADYDKWHKIASGFYNTARDYYRAVQSMNTAVNSIADNSVEAYNIATLTETYYEYGPAGEVLSQTTLNYVPTLARQNQKTHRISKIWTTSGGANGAQTEVTTGFTIRWTDLELIEDREVPSGKVEIGNFLSEYPVDLVSQNTKTYIYGSRWTTERDEYVDYENPENNYVSENYSSSQSANPIQPDRIEAEVTGEDSIFTDESSIDTGSNNPSNVSSDPENTPAEEDPEEYCDEETRTVDKSFTVRLSRSNPSIATGWFGKPTKYKKVVSMPLDFVPLKLKKHRQGYCLGTDFTNTLIRYESYIRRYAYVRASKILGDNRGFRITESMRAEVFGYHPFYPVQINLSSAGVAFNTRVASSNWVFDGSNALCSFDCLTYSQTTLTSFPRPSLANAFFKTEGAKVLTVAELKIPATAAKIKISTLPESGNLQLNGVNVAIGDVVTVAQINAGNFSFVP